ncbi:MAG: DUF2180 family protein [Candidatus Thermoplasmatota archaeon]|nr:DUF2180 family protein [Candidatus Thermoplasmatota archaeon]
MLCYKCAKEGKNTEAVGICVVCGMGLCQEHVHIVEVSFWEISMLDAHSISGLGLDTKEEKKAPRFLCDECYASVAKDQDRLTGAV